jgi:hypothetical protein
MTDNEELRAQTKALEEKAAAIRQDVEFLLREVDGRRLGVRRLRMRLQEHPVAAITAGVVLGVAGLGIVLLAAHRRQQRSAFWPRLLAYRAAVRRMAKNPESIAR